MTVGTLRQTSTNVSADGALVAGSIEPDVRRQREGDPDEAVLAKIAEVAGVVAVGPEVVGVDRPEQRIVGVGIPLAPALQELEPRLDVGRRQLEVVGRHVAVGAGAAVAAQAIQLPVEERAQAARDGVAGLAAAVVAWRSDSRPACRSCASGGTSALLARISSVDEQHEAAGDQQ